MGKGTNKLKDTGGTSAHPSMHQTESVPSVGSGR
jgi:hypothetical protein